MKTFNSATVMALAVIAATPAIAGNKLEETVVVSSRTQMPLRQVGTSVSIITKEDLELRGFTTLANALRYDPSISVINNGGAGKVTSLRIRGEIGFRTKLILDGMELTDTSSPQAGPHFTHLLTNGLSRVEILRGPQGVMYGADAGGIVSVDTVRPEAGLGGSVSGEYGRYGSSNLVASLGGRNAIGDFSVVASDYETDGFNSRDFDVTVKDDDGYENATFYVRGGWNITPALRAELQGRSVDGDSEFDSCFEAVTFAPTDRCSSEHEEESWRAALRFTTGNHTGEVSYMNNATERASLALGVSTFATKGELEEFGYVGNWAVSEDTHIVYGADLRNESIDDGIEDVDRDQNGIYLEYQAGFGNQLFVTLGGRYDDNDDFGSETTYRVSGAYLLPVAGGEVKLKTTYGTGFRAPSLSEIAYNNNPFSAFPPALGLELSEESSEGFDIGAGYYADNGGFAEITLFSQKVEDEIFFDLVDFSGYFQGNGDSESKGVELVGEAPLGEMLTITGNYTYTDAEDADGEHRLRAHKHLGNFGAHLAPLERLRISLNLRVSHDAPQETSGNVDDYEVIDLSASYQLVNGLELFGRVENLTDEDYQELPSFNTSGAAAYVGVRYDFQSN
ncbi:MAG: TonB-dependent receptor [Halioglobus sp.]|nr:TonB-dependent receptor [Halioglobus sp.]